VPATGPDESEITAWALAARSGDRAAASAFIRATTRDVHRFLSHLADREDVEDLAQDTYLRAMRALPRFDGRSTAKTWLLSIARRAAADHIRTLRRRPRPAWGPPSPDAEAVPSFDGEILLRRLLSGLEPGRREAFLATQVLGLSYAEAADVCQCPVGTIRSRVARAREDLVTALRADDRARNERGGGDARQNLRADDRARNERGGGDARPNLRADEGRAAAT
jgi:RNA polymerase sigma-70 factor (ECF subfamily)